MTKTKKPSPETSLVKPMSGSKPLPIPTSMPMPMPMSIPIPMPPDRRVVHFYPPVGLSTLFRPLPKAKGRPTLDVHYQPAVEGPLLRFSAKAALGIPEQTLLLVLLELAREQFLSEREEVLVSARSTHPLGQKLWGHLHTTDPQAEGETLRLETTWYELNRRCGGQSNGATQLLRSKQLERLCEVIVWESYGDDLRTKRQSYLVVLLVGNDHRLHLALNRRLASALLGQHYAQVSLTERLALKRDIPMALHAFLSTTVKQGNSLLVGLDKLVNRLWPTSSETALAGTHRRRRSDVRNGLRDLGRLPGWSVAWEREGMARVVRNWDSTRTGRSTGSNSNSSSSGSGSGSGQADGQSVRDMTCLNANKSMSYREQASAINTSNNKGLRGFDVSGLFITKH